MPSNHFAGYLFWPGDKFYYSGVDPANEARL